MSPRSRAIRRDADELDLSMISAAYLAQFDGVLMSTIGELPLNDEQTVGPDRLRQRGARASWVCTKSR